MFSPIDIAAALERAGSRQLPPRGLAYLSGRLAPQLAGGGIDPEHPNLGLLRETTFGAAKKKTASQKKAQIAKAVADVRAMLGGKPWFVAAQPTQHRVRVVVTHANAQIKKLIPKTINGIKTFVKLGHKAGASQSAPVQQQYDQAPPPPVYDVYDQGLPQYDQAPQYAESPGAQPESVYDQPEFAPDDGAAGEEGEGEEVIAADDGGAGVEGASGAPDGPAFASFPDINAAARALVATSYRAMPRDWGTVGASEMARLGTYPISRVNKIEGTPLGWVPGFGPSAEAEQTFRGLTADWEAFERLNAAGRLPPQLRQDIIEWRDFRDKWQKGEIDSSDIGGKLTAEVIRANRIRKELADAKIVDPAIGPGLRQGVDVLQSAGRLKTAADIESWAKGIPLLNWATDPRGGPYRTPLTLAGIAIGLGLLWVAVRKGSGPNIYISRAR